MTVLMKMRWQYGTAPNYINNNKKKCHQILTQKSLITKTKILLKRREEKEKATQQICFVSWKQHYFVNHSSYFCNKFLKMVLIWFMYATAKTILLYVIMTCISFCVGRSTRDGEKNIPFRNLKKSKVEGIQARFYTVFYSSIPLPK